MEDLKKLHRVTDTLLKIFVFEIWLLLAVAVALAIDGKYFEAFMAVDVAGIGFVAYKIAQTGRP